MDTLRQDIRHALRLLTRRPGWAAAALLTLAVGIGATAAIYAVVESVVLRPLPYPESERLVQLRQVDAETGEGGYPVFTYPWYEAWSAEQDVLPSLGVYAAQTVTLNRADGSERIPGALAGAATLRMLGVQPLMGRTFLAEEDLEGAAPVVLLSHGAWRTRFGGRADIVGSEVVVNERPRVVVGVMPAGFDFPAPGTELWLPLATAHRAPGTAYLSMLARLPADLTPEAAEAGLARAVRLEADDEGSQRVRLEAQPLRDAVLGDARPLLALFAGAVVALLLIATLNVANLLLVRSAERDRELTVRAALGAGRGRLAVLHLVEGLVLAGLATVLGLALALWVIEGLSALGPDVLPRAGEIALRPSMVAFSALLAAGVGIAIGLAPALRAPPVSLTTRLRAATPATSAGGGGRLRAALVVTQVALATVLLAAGGLLVRSFAELTGTESGLRTASVATVGVFLPSSRYPDGARIRAFHESLGERLEARPEVVSTAAVSFLPFTPARSVYDLEVEGRAAPEDGAAEVLFATPGYFETMGVPVLDGRALSAADGEGALPVVVVSEALARRHWPEGGVVGSRVRLEDETWRTVVGVAGDVRQHGLDAAPAAQLFIPYAQAGSKWPFGMSVLVRARGSAASVAPVVRAAVADLDPGAAVASVRPLDELRAASVAGPRLRAVLIGLFAAAALLLAVVGVYGVMAYATARRTREVGIRIALGATGGRIVGGILARGVAMTAGGVAVGLAGALAAGRALEGYLHGVGRSDPATLAAIVVLLGAASLGAAYIPARRASRLAPVDALRTE